MKINQHRQVLWNWRRFLHLELIDGHHLSFAAHPEKLYLGPKFEYFPWDLPECHNHHYGYSKSHIMLQANNSSNRIQNVPGFGCFENRFCGATKKTPPPSPGRPILETHHISQTLHTFRRGNSRPRFRGDSSHLRWNESAVDWWLCSCNACNQSETLLNSDDFTLQTSRV